MSAATKLYAKKRFDSCSNITVVGIQWIKIQRTATIAHSRRIIK